MTNKAASKPAILSVAVETAAEQTRNALLAHAGYHVIPADSLESALEALSSRHISAMVISHTLDSNECRALTGEARRRGVPLLVLDPYDHHPEDKMEIHVNPLDGPEVFLSALAALVGSPTQS
jgi:DNA-binding response OmpR family regulator